MLILKIQRHTKYNDPSKRDASPENQKAGEVIFLIIFSYQIFHLFLK